MYVRVCAGREARRFEAVVRAAEGFIPSGYDRWAGGG